MHKTFEATLGYLTPCLQKRERGRGKKGGRKGEKTAVKLAAKKE